MSSSDRKLTGAFKLFQPSVEIVKKNWKAYALILFLPQLLISATELVGPGVKVTDNLYTTMFGVGIGSLLALIGVGLAIFLLPAGFLLVTETARGKIVDPIELIKRSLKFFLPMLGLVILLILVIGLGFVALIVPGVWLLHRYGFAPYVMVAENLNISDSLKRSAEIVKGHPLAVWGLIGVVILLSLIGALPVPILATLVSLALITTYEASFGLRYLELTQPAA